MIGLLLALYPAHWRRRYGEEFRAVLESRTLGPFDVADVLLGALDARLTRFRLVGALGPEGGHLMVLRIGGFAAIGGGILWFSGIAGMSAGTAPEGLWIAIATLGNLGILVALAGLSAFQAHRHPRLAWAAFAIPGVGTMLSVVGIAGMASGHGDSPLLASITPWWFWFMGLITTLVGSVLFAAATLRAAVLSSRAAIALAISSMAAIYVGTSGSQTDAGSQLLLYANVATFASFAVSWVVLGVTALRRGPIRAVAPA